MLKSRVLGPTQIYPAGYIYLTNIGTPFASFAVNI